MRSAAGMPLIREVLLRRSLLLALDAGLIVISFWGAFTLRVGAPFSPFFLSNLFLLPWALGIGLAVLFGCGWYRGLTRYSGSHSLYGVVPWVWLTVLLLLLVCTLSGNPLPPPRTFWILYGVLLTGALVASRILLRDVLRFVLARRNGPASNPVLSHSSTAPQAPAAVEPAALPTLIYGAGEAARLLIDGLRYQPRFRLVGLVDDDPALRGRRLGRLPIHGSGELAGLIERHAIRQVLLALPEMPRPQRRELVERIRGLGVSVLAMPSLAAIAAGDQAVTDLRPVSIEDLLGREPSRPDPALLKAAVVDRAVLVTGAGGSIGGELCRQILRLGARSLVLLERSEFALYSLEQELLTAMAQGPGPWPALHPVLGDACSRARLEDLCRRHRIQVLFHAAAYKHVPLVERNLCAGVANNVLSTRAAVEAAIACGLERLLLISTDKAVRPPNAMGASKRICELLVQDAVARLAAHGQARPVMAMVRFGNVLASSGSVVPCFRQQIAAGGPVTVTHPEITRYFMTIPEAVQLVLQAAGMARGGEVFVLDMGEPVRILDLARQMIRLSGATVRDEAHPDGEIAIRFTGLRPGEKLHEELLLRDDDEPTAHPLIRRAQEESLPSRRLHPLVDRLEVALAAWDAEAVRRVLAELVPAYGTAMGLTTPLPTSDGRHRGS